jgi:hypothetical protein
MAVSNPAPKKFDEYIERDAAGNRQLRKYEAEIASGQRRLDCPNDAIVQSEWKSELKLASGEDRGGIARRM